MFRASCSSSLLKGYDEPETLRCSNHQICPTGADVKQADLTGTPEGAKLINLGELNIGDIANRYTELGGPGIAFWVENENVTYPGNLVQTLRAKLKADNVYTSIAYLRDVGRTEIDCRVGDVVDFLSGQPFNNYSFWFEGDELETGEFYLGAAHNRVFMLAPKVSAKIRGLDLVTTRAAGAGVIDGSGDVSFVDGQIRSTASGAAFDDKGHADGGANTFAGILSFDRFDLNETVQSAFLPADKVRESDSLTASAAVNPGSIAAGAVYTQDITFPGVQNGDRIIATPASTLSAQEKFTWSAYFQTTNTARLAVRNVSTTAQNPGSQTWNFRAERG